MPCQDKGIYIFGSSLATVPRSSLFLLEEKQEAKKQTQELRVMVVTEVTAEEYFFPNIVSKVFAQDYLTILLKVADSIYPETQDDL